MKQPLVSPFRKALSYCLALVMIALVLFAAHSQTHPPPAAAQSQLVWVRQDPPVINQRNDPTFWECPEGVHCEGSFWDYRVDETEIIKEERYVNNGHEYYHIILESQFDRPPQVINPGSRYKVRASFSHRWVSGTPTYGECLYFQYHSPSSPWLAEPPWDHDYCPWSDSFDGTASAEWMLDPGWPFKEGDTFEITAEWIYDDPANVTWTYRAEPATPADETQLGAEVVAPVVSYQGEEVPPGETFFPETCDLPLNRSSEACANAIGLEEQARLNLGCVRLDKLARLMIIMELLDLEEYPAFVWAMYHKLARDCGMASARADDDFELGLYLEQGGLLLTNTIAGQTVDVATPLATATTTRPGAFVAGFNPATQVATFRAFGVPLTVRPNTGAPLILEPYEGVELTADGFGPVDNLPHVFLPLQIR